MRNSNTPAATMIAAAKDAHLFLSAPENRDKFIMCIKHIREKHGLGLYEAKIAAEAGRDGISVVDAEDKIKIRQHNFAREIELHLEKEEEYLVRLTYFKTNGTYYSSAGYQTNKTNIVSIWQEVEDMCRDCRAPGINGDPQDFIVQIVVPGHRESFPKLIIPRSMQ